jgi:hypothetical protein
VERLRLLSVCLFAAALIVLSWSPGVAGASPVNVVTFEAPSELFDDATRDAALDEIVALGADGLRVVMPWQNVAPKPRARRRPRFDATNPRSYRWGVFDRIIDGASQRRLRVLLTVSSPVPRWATPAGRDFVTSPRPREFGHFMTAVGRHYGGRIAAWLIWNEPNHARFLRPQSAGGRPRSPLIYRALYLAARRGLRRAGRGHDPVVTGEVAPSSTRTGIAPLAFLRGMLCLNAHYRPIRRCGPLQAAGLGVHPYAFGGGPFPRFADPDQVTISTLRRLIRVLDRAARAGAISKRLPIYVTEFGIQSFPDRLIGVDPLKAAEFRSISELIAYRNRRVRSFSQYLMHDDADLGSFQTGLRYADGRRKPGYQGFRLPLVAQHRRGKVLIWGLVRPARGRTIVRLQKSLRPGAWRTQRVVRTGRTGSWRFTVRFMRRARWRVAWRAPDGVTHTGPPTRAYRWPSGL